MFSFLTALLLAFVLVHAEDVVTLTSANFEDVIQNTPRVLVEFYAPWCGHCKALAPEYEKAASALKEQGIDTILAKVDATEEKDLSSKYGVRGFPTLKYFTNGDLENPADYTGGRTEATIVSWISKRALPALSTISTQDELDAFLKKDDVVLIGFYTEDSTEYKTLAELADLTRESAVTAVVTDPDIQGDRANSLRLIVGGQEITYEGDLDAADIQSWINVERFPLVGEIGPENYKDYMDRGLPLVWIALDPEDEPTKQRVVSALTPAAQSNKGKVSFVTIDAKKFQQHVQNLGITNVPGLLVINGNDKYRFDADEITEETVTQFFENYNAGQVAKFLKTQPPPEKNDEPVFVLVGSTFPDVVGQDKDVFVEFYAPWCGHCKRLAPEYEKVGQAFADVPDMVIAKIDATENDTPEDIRGFPTLVFYPKGESQGTKYQGERNAEAITEWLQKQATVDVSGLKTDL